MMLMSMRLDEASHAAAGPRRNLTAAVGWAVVVWFGS
jgi:hypothetical protein